MVSKVAIIDCGSSKISELETKMIALNVKFEIIPMTKFNESTHESFDALIISGSPFLFKDRDTDILLKNYSFIATLNLPILGICFGHQLLGFVNGAEVFEMDEDRDWQEIEIIESSILFNQLEQPIKMMEDHIEAVSVPGTFKLIATSEKCKNEAMQHKVLPHFGVQFHPESSEQKGLQLLRNFISGF